MQTQVNTFFVQLKLLKATVNGLFMKNYIELHYFHILIKYSYY